MLSPKPYCQSTRPTLVLLALFLALTPPAPVSAHHVGDSTPAPLAVTEYLIMLDMQPRNTKVRNRLAAIYLKQNKLKRAATQFEEVLKIKPDDFLALQGMGLVLTRQKKFAEALVYLHQAVQVKPDDPMVYFHLGRASEKNNALQEAELAYRTAEENGIGLQANDSAAITEALTRIRQKIDQAHPREAE